MTNSAIPQSAIQNPKSKIIVGQHRHCQVCGHAVGVKEEYCGEKCRNEFEAMVRKKKKSIYVLYAGMVGVLVLTFVLYAR